jgi:4'-phosphopantetheinyl transferase
MATRDEVHLWTFSLNVGPSGLLRLWDTLSEDEKRRSEQFYFQREREKFIAARGLTRSLLGQYLQEDPGRLEFRYGPFGKPSLALDGAALDIRFNVSRSGGLALCAVALSREVGVDLEQARPDYPLLEVAAHCFPEEERAALLALSEPARSRAFLTSWTVKEAWLKAQGTGILWKLEDLMVTVHGDRAGLMRLGAAPQHISEGWNIIVVEPASGFVAAVAALGRDWQLVPHR